MTPPGELEDPEVLRARIRADQAAADGAPGSPGWAVTYADVMALLLSFFILMLSFSAVDAERFRALAGSIRASFGVRVPPKEVRGERGGPASGSAAIEHPAKVLETRLREELAPLQAGQVAGQVDVEVFETYRGIVVLVPADALFVAGTDRLTEPARHLLRFVGLATGELAPGTELVVEARAGGSATRAPQFADPWSLTAAQAVAVAQLLRSAGGIRPERVVPVARGAAPPSAEAAARGPVVELLFMTAPISPGGAP